MDTNAHPEVLLHDPLRGAWFHGVNPVAVLQARTLADVRPLLREVEHSVNSRGRHAAGFITYEAAPAFDSALTVRRDSSPFPLAWFALFDTPAWLPNLPPAFPPVKPGSLSWTPSIPHEAYNAGVARLRDYLHDGDTYQVNFTWRLRTACADDPKALFAQLVRAQGPHYSAYVHTGPFTICSASPELFFRLDNNTVESRPMKGTIARGRSAAEDRQQAERLRQSEKNRAENIMIVDMIRNDLGRVAIPGSVSPDRLFDVERYPTVWQMTSTVRCRTEASFDAIMAALFPCASITGAPKPRTMEIIAELEDSPRRLYTGAIGYLAPGRQAQFNVAIRTLIRDNSARTAEYGVGGGIVWDSVPRDEYEECLLKAAVLLPPAPDFSLLETMLWTPEDGFFLLDRHLNRLADSAEYFDIPIAIDAIRDRLASWSMEHTAPPATGSFRVRLLVDSNGSITIESAPLDTGAGNPATVAIAPAPIDPADRFLFHKTTRRTVYDNAKAACPGVDDVLLWNPSGELTESTIANLVTDLDGRLVTPPVECGLLPGTYRAELLAQGRIQEGIIRVADLPRCRALFLISSVRKWRQAAITPSSGL